MTDGKKPVPASVSVNLELLCDAEVRVRCLEIANGEEVYGDSTDAKLERAEKYVAWVKKGSK